MSESCSCAAAICFTQCVVSKTPLDSEEKKIYDENVIHTGSLKTQEYTKNQFSCKF